MQESQTKGYTPEEYLAREEQADYKSEYRDGEIVALAGGSRNHALIQTNIITALGQGLEKRPCEVYASDLRVHVARSRLYTYPDVMVICGKPEFVPGRDDTVTNPILLVEVLSPSTRDYDRVRKFSYYKRLDSLQEYLLVDSEQVHVTRLTRTEGNQWTIEMFDDLDDTVPLQSLSIDIPLRRIYSKVEFAQ